MIYLLIFSAMLTAFYYSLKATVRTDYKRILLHRLMANHIKMVALYKKLEVLLFIKGYHAYAARNNRMSYDLYLAGVKKQNEIFDREMDELRAAKLNADTQKYYLQLVRTHEHELALLQSEINRVAHTHELHPHNQQSA